MSIEKALRVAYAGTPEFARVGLEAIVKAGYEVPLVLTQPDRPAGRGMKLQPSAVKQFAIEHHIDVLQPTGLRLDGRYAQEAQQAKEVLELIRPDVMVVAAYGLILPQWVLDLPRLGCLNIHASLLPRWRGAAPIHRAIEAGDACTGVTIMQMDAGLDTGPMLQSASLEIGPADTTATLHDRLAVQGSELVVQVLAKALAGKLEPVAQPQEGVTYASKIEKSEGQVNWSEPAVVIERRIRAFDPFPGVSTQRSVQNERQTIKLWQAQALPATPQIQGKSVGEVISASPQQIQIVTGDGILAVSELQRPGGKCQPVREFLQAVPVEIGEKWL